MLCFCIFSRFSIHVSHSRTWILSDMDVNISRHRSPEKMSHQPRVIKPGTRQANIGPSGVSVELVCLVCSTRRAHVGSS